MDTVIWISSFLLLGNQLPYLKPQHQALAFGSGTAGGELIVGRFFVIGKKVVAVIRDAMNNRRQARAANTLFTGHGDINTGVIECFKGALIGGNGDDLATAFDHQFKRTVSRAVEVMDWSGKKLPVQAGFVPALLPGTIKNVVDKAPRATNVQVRTGWGGGDDSGDIETLIVIIEITVAVSCQRRLLKLVTEGCCRPGACGVVDFKVTA